ncbi:phage head morphogenesis protein, partial [Staphylococcus aureus]|nr:phage head morphogenesis protein [Staphylococcus aureus]
QNFQSSGCVGQAPKLFIGVNSAKENINCRCKLLYYIDEDELPTVMRVRNDDGENEVIPFMNYREWEEHKRKKK